MLTEEGWEYDGRESGLAADTCLNLPASSTGKSGGTKEVRDSGGGGGMFTVVMVVVVVVGTIVGDSCGMAVMGLV